MIASSLRLRRPLAAVLAVALLVTGAPAARATAGTVVANNGSGNGIASGRVVRADPDNARVTVTNGFHFWAVLDVSYVGGSSLLRPTDPRVDIGGIFAGGGLIGPGSTASWDGQFSAGSQALVRVHYDLSSAGGAAALAANLLTIIADSLGASLSASSSSRLLTALKVITDLSTWADFVRQAQTNDIWGLVTSVELMLGSKTGRDTIRYALAQLGVVTSDAALIKLASVVGIIDWARTLFDIYRAVLTGRNDGTVIFSVAPPVVTPAPTIAPTPTPGATAAPAGQIYTLVAGDTLAKVAARFGLTLDALLMANPQITNPDRIAVGDRIVIPTAAPATPEPTVKPVACNTVYATGWQGEGVYQLDMAQGRIVNSTTTSLYNNRYLAWNPVRQELYVLADNGGVISVVGVNPLREVGTISADVGWNGNSIAVSPDGRTIVATFANGDATHGGLFRRVVEYDAASGTERHALILSNTYGESYAAISPDGSRVYVSWDDKLDIYDAASMSLIKRISGIVTGSGRLVATSDGRYLLIAQSGTLLKYDLRTEQVTGNAPVDEGSGFSWMALSRDESAVWVLGTTVVYRVPLSMTGVTSASVEEPLGFDESTDGMRLFVAHGYKTGVVSVVDIATGRVTGSIPVANATGLVAVPCQ